MAWNLGSSRRISHPPSLLHHNSHQTKNKHKQHFTNRRRAISVKTCYGLCLIGAVSSCSLLLILHWPYVPPCLHFFPHLFLTTSLQCHLLLLPKLPKVHSCNHQLPCSSHHLLNPPCLSNRIRGLSQQQNL